MFQPTLVSQRSELEQVLHLQARNLAHTLSGDERNQQGFLTLQHDLATLTTMHELAPSVIIKHDSEVVGYALTMLPECRQLITELEAMFSLFERLNWNGQPLKELAFYVMGQVCVDKRYRGLGLFDKLYAYHKEIYSLRFQLLLTEISARNGRSLNAHQRVGFKSLHQHRDSLDLWSIVAWDWQ